MKAKGTLSTDLAPQHGREVELSYANTGKDKVKSRYNLVWGLSDIFGRDDHWTISYTSYTAVLANCYIQG